MAKELWVEKYRPKHIEDYVFCDGAMKTQIIEWINEKAIPHILLSGIQGIGKCLDGNELIDIEIDISKLTNQQKKILKL